MAAATRRHPGLTRAQMKGEGDARRRARPAGPRPGE